MCTRWATQRHDLALALGRMELSLYSVVLAAILESHSSWGAMTESKMRPRFVSDGVRWWHYERFLLTS